MTLEKAEEIRKLLNHKDALVAELKDLMGCKSIDGHINDGTNGLGFRWDENSRQVMYLIEGTKKEIEAVEKAIINFK